MWELVVGCSSEEEYTLAHVCFENVDWFVTRIVENEHETHATLRIVERNGHETTEEYTKQVFGEFYREAEIKTCRITSAIRTFSVDVPLCFSHPGTKKVFPDETSLRFDVFEPGKGTVIAVGLFEDAKKAAEEYVREMVGTSKKA